MKAFFVHSFVFLCLSVYGQPFSTSTYIEQDGLISSVVYCSFQDSKGFLWFGTDRGVSRFNGSEFTNFTMDDGLADHEIFHIFEDSKERIWMLAYNGKLSYFQHGYFYNQENRPFLKETESTSFFYFGIEDNLGNLYFLTYNGTILQLNADNQVFKLPTVTKLGQHGITELNDHVYCLEDRYIFRIRPDQSMDTVTAFNHSFDRGTWISSIGSALVVVYSNSESEVVLHFCSPEKSPHITTQKLDIRLGKLQAINRISDDRLLIMGREGSGVISISDTSYTFSRLSYNNTSSGLKDIDGNYWLGLLNEGVIHFRKTESAKKWNLGKPLYSICKDPSNEDIWAGTVGKVYHFAGDSVETFPLMEARHHKVRQLFWLNDELFILTSNGMFRMKQNKIQRWNEMGLKRIDFFKDSLYMASSQLIAAAYSGDYLNAAQPVEAIDTLLKRRSLCIEVDSSGQIWVGHNYGLSTIVQNKEIALPTNLNSIKTRIVDIALEGGKNLWFASSIEGLFHYDRDKVNLLNREDGLLSDNVYVVECDAQNQVWVGTDRGLSKITVKQGAYEIQNFTNIEGLINVSIQDILIHGDSIWLATSEGLVLFLPKNHISKPNPPRMALTELTVNYKERSVLSNYEFKPGENNIRIAFEGINFQGSKDLLFRYRLRPDDEWQFTTNQTIELIAIPSGRYHFTVQCSRFDDNWSGQCEIRFTILQYFYKMIWFKSLVFIGITALGGILFFGWYKNFKRRSRLEQQIAYSEQKALRAQMNPHFLFNCLNSIQNFFLENQAKMGFEYLGKFGMLIRRILDNSEKTYLSLNEELETIKLYMNLEQIRVKNKFEVSISISPEIDAYNSYVPGMLIQPFVENSIWHGLNYLESGGKLFIDIQSFGEGLKIKIGDNGIGRKKSEEINRKRMKNHSSKGMQLVKDRISMLNALHNETIDLKIEDIHPTGTLVTLILPN